MGKNIADFFEGKRDGSASARKAIEDSPGYSRRGGIGGHVTGWDGTGWDGTGSDEIWGGMGWDGMGWGGMG